VFRRHWLEPRFWILWWRWRLSPEFRTAAILGLFVLLLGAGWVAADQLSSANASGTNQDAVLETTVERTVTVHKLRAAAPAVSVRTRVVTRQVVRYRPTTRVETRTRTAVVTAARVVTTTAVVTRKLVEEHTITRSNPTTVVLTVTRSVTRTAPPITVTETLPPETVVVTVTVKRH
jgi:hypothetical protein